MIFLIQLKIGHPDVALQTPNDGVSKATHSNPVFLLCHKQVVAPTLGPADPSFWTMQGASELPAVRAT